MGRRIRRDDPRTQRRPTHHRARHRDPYPSHARGSDLASTRLVPARQLTPGRVVHARITYAERND
jgi:hypothetical protein